MCHHCTERDLSFDRFFFCRTRNGHARNARGVKRSWWKKSTMVWYPEDIAVPSFRWLLFGFALRFLGDFFVPLLRTQSRRHAQQQHTHTTTALRHVVFGTARSRQNAHWRGCGIVRLWRPSWILFDRLVYTSCWVGYKYEVILEPKLIENCFNFK